MLAIGFAETENASLNGAKPPAVAAPGPAAENRVILTPPAPSKPRINGPKAYSVRPGSPFLCRIPATGERPMKFSARDLPEGLVLDAVSGIVTGRIADRSRKNHSVILVAENAKGRVEREFRIVVLNLCQYGMGEVWKWGAEVGGNSWRTTGDLGLEESASLPGFYRIGLANAQHSADAGPGHWNDPDYILIGWYGNARAMGEAQKANLTPDECYSYMSMWSLMAAPLFFSGDMARLDAFTLNVLCNSEVIEVDQDILGRQGRIVRQSAQELVLAKSLADGSVAVGLFNLDTRPRRMEISWSDLSVQGRCRVRDLWRQKDLEVMAGAYSAVVSRHGVSMVKIIQAR
jgi:hypothetical protein